MPRQQQDTPFYERERLKNMGNKNAQEADDLIDEAGEALDDGDAEHALELAQTALVLDPKNSAAAITVAEAMCTLGQTSDAIPVLEKALKIHPKDGELCWTTAVVYLQSADDEHDSEPLEKSLQLLQRAEKLAKEEDDEPLLGDIERTRSQALGLLGQLVESLAALERARAFLGEDDDLLLEIAAARFEVLDLDGSKELLERLQKAMPEEPDVQHYLGLIAERQGNKAVAESHFAEARKLDPETYPAHVSFTHEEFEAAVESALAKLPQKVRDAMKDVTVMVEDLPKDDDLKTDMLSPQSLGMFRGTPHGEKSVFDAGGQLPPSILLYQRNIERFCETREDLVSEIEDTIVHEVGHFVGFDEEELAERGLQ